MTNIVGVRFKKVGKIYYFDPQGLVIRAGEQVIVETARGVEYGECALGNTDVDDGEVVKPLRRVLRIANQTDLQVARSNEEQGRKAYEICKKKIAEHKLDMHLVSVECTFDLNKILFYFTADGRVDFRALVKDLASIFHTRIELRQIGVRDEAKMVGGLGICGRELCCSSYLEDFQPVSINMAKDQNLSLNPAKISGTCGRLMCCLKYEHEGYHDLQKITPRVDSLVETPEGRGTVVAVQMLAGTCKVALEDEPDNPQVFACQDCTMLRSGRGKRPAQEPHKNDAKPERGGKAEHKSDAPHKPERKTQPAAPVETEPAAEDTAPASNEEAGGENKPRRRRRGGARRRHKPNGESHEGSTAPSGE